MYCATCQRLEEVVAKASRDWAFAEQLAEVSGRMPELAEPARRKADAVHKEYTLALSTLGEHREQCTAFRARASSSVGGVS